jgi:cytochrome d ubiquinol oxidase subunit II
VIAPVAGAALVALVTLTLYLVLGGADFGGGVWDLFARGPRRTAQRDTISNAIGPVWEANHVWLIFAIVTMFTCFPPAFADIATNLNAPLTLALIGIVLRGAAFIFRNYALDVPTIARSWAVVFGVASIAAPFFLGDAAGAVATGRYAWTSPFALTIGVFAVALCAQIAAVFLLRETRDHALREDFRRRAVRATLAVWIIGALAAALAYQTEPQFFAALTNPAARIVVASAMLLGIIVMLLIANHRDISARIAVGAQTVCVLAGWFGAQAPNLIPGRYTYETAASPTPTLQAYLIAATCGSLILIPSLLFLFLTFKGHLTTARD